MFDKLEILNMAHGMATHAASRQSVLARNIANADTPGYRARDISSFADSYTQAGDFTPRQTRAGHMAATGPGGPDLAEHIVRGQSTSPNGNGVSLEVEMTKAAETRVQHDMALGVYKTTLGILRASLGK
ncbi:FlgB family protein [Actibacterium sp. XHP0104]|uniref:FlgB family protein n=1 Tax=Actibacterium sp. XHP0104 TaxID=2984335 RepID=UPI0021E74B50|nr:FlgB family protein [Actibacterium sp. XHP0104]MCV2881799.1 FlgB family protein [Actibacterium sp. XHP0104]